MAFGGGGIRAGQAFVEFFLDKKKFDKKLDKLGADMRKFGKIGLAATAPLIAGFGAALKIFADVGDELHKMSQRTGLSVEALSELKFAASQSGTSITSVEKAVKRMATTLFDAQLGLSTAIDALDALGLSIEDLERLKPEEQFYALSRAIGAIEDPTRRAAVAQKVFGRAGTELLPMLNQGADGMDKMRQRAQELGITFDQDAADAAAKLTDEMDAVKQQLIALALQIGYAISGPVTEMITSIQEVLANTIAWVKANPELVRGIAKVTAAVAAASAAMVTLGIVLSIISAHPIIAFISLLAGLVVGLATYFGLASDSADEFKKSLDGIKTPGGGAAADTDFQAEADRAQAELRAAVSGQTASVVSSAAASETEKLMAKDIGNIEKYTRLMADGIDELVNIARNRDPGFIAGVG